jgi:predicted GNAT family N-acyltransferase
MTTRTLELKAGPSATNGTLELTLGDWATMQALVQPIRITVFVEEQGIDPALEWDDADAVSIHCLARLDGMPVGTGRLLPDGHIGRMAVRRPARRSGLGGAILLTLLKAAGERGDRVVELSAQRYVEAFYRRHGFVAEGEPYLEAGIEHVRMRRDFSALNAGN